MYRPVLYRIVCTSVLLPAPMALERRRTTNPRTWKRGSSKLWLVLMIMIYMVKSCLHLVLAMVDQPLGSAQHRVVGADQLSQVHLMDVKKVLRLILEI